jgi:hypothetical protein
MTTIRSKTIELNESDFDRLIRGATSRIVVTDETSRPPKGVMWQWHKEITIRQLQILRQLIDSAINDFHRAEREE